VARQPVEILPSILTADFAHLGEECLALERAGADRFHWDVMDGRYVPNITLGPPVIASARKVVQREFEAHVMCERPEGLLPAYQAAGCSTVVLHPETLQMPARTYQQIRDMGMRVGVALSPHIPLVVLEDTLDLIDQVLIMTVNPGFGGQSYLESMEAKIRRTRSLLDGSGLPIRLEVDGGIAADTITGAATAGADTFVVGSALWRYADFSTGVSELREMAETVSA
jgi:ribulose-phosphate 3-epimerase